MPKPAQGINLPQDAYAHFKNTPGFDAAAFAAAHTGVPPVSFRQNLKKYTYVDNSLHTVPWCGHAYFLKERPKFQLDPLWHAGAYYVQESSSMFVHHIIKQLFTNSTPLIVLDTCAAPGGKSTLLTDALPAGSLLISNEVIPKRAGILYENMEKWGRINNVVTQSELRHLSQLNTLFDVIVVDAPCSGSGLWRKDPKSIDEWAETLVYECAARQKQILNEVWPMLKQGGYLIYSTCSFSKQENEAVIDHLASIFSLNPVSIETEESWNVFKSETPEHGAPVYRFYPYNLSGEGFAVAVIQKLSEELSPRPSAQKAKVVKSSQWPYRSFQDEVLIHEWEPNRFRAWPAQWQHILPSINNYKGLKKAGIYIGELKGKDFIPDHAFAMSELINKESESSIDINLAESLKFLKKENINIEHLVPGWNLLTYQNIPLGWVKKAGDRVNNYYPTAWRLRQG